MESALEEIGVLSGNGFPRRHVKRIVAEAGLGGSLCQPELLLFAEQNSPFGVLA
jgi:hypothetical protein